ncbi:MULTISPECIES: lecithin retinol acyltransferase family protein [Burkholderiaceae]|uniref:lecithin retinol acyltransferase family protein n=1 Tax=Burkholderiaceae TaxID=119060 RepID=UPI00158A7F7A|nr:MULTISPECIES: lecithin retinol acyltransferase family protein [Burkholderiaceae]MBU7436134.1 lecithin retinol acyltransferase family protein [Paraburkholderia fungorum]
MSDDERQIRAGDHLWVQRLGYEHHGLASGRDTVIHYSGKDGVFDTGVIEEVPLSTFAKGRKVRFVDHPDRLHGRLESVRRARQRIGETEYNLVFNNCEHFVMWCIEDKHTSEQVNDAVRTTGNIAATAMMYRWYQTWAMEEAMGPTVRVATQMLSAGRTASTVTSAMNAASAARTAASLAPTVSAALTSSAPAATTAIANGLTAAGLTGVVGGAGAAAVGIVSAPVSIPVVAVAAGVGLAVTAVSAIWDSIFD